MSLFEISLTVIALFGHAALWIGVYNRLHALPLSCRAVKRLEKPIYLAFVGLPLLWLWAVAWRNFEIARPHDAGSLLPLWLYLATCCGVTLGPGLLWLVRPCGANRRAVLLSNDSQYRDVGRELRQPLLHGRMARTLARVPGNQVLELEINEKTLHLPNLPPELEGLSIVHLSDLHYTGAIGRPFFEYVMDEANRLQGDLMAVTGDIVDEPACLAWIPSTLGRLSCRHGVYGVLGNHDKRLRDMSALRSALADAGIHMLGGRWTEIQIRETPVVLAGDERPWFTPGPDLRDGPSPDAVFRTLLAHTPDRFAWAQAQRFPLMLAGHNHGGQIRFPWVGPIVAPSLHGVKYASGVYREGPTTLHVSRGISGVHPIRLNCRPELTKLVLTRDAEPPRLTDGG